jgi:hypothetical protein
MTDFNLATADKHQMKFYAKSLGLDLSLAMAETTMREKIEAHLIKTDQPAPKSEVAGIKKGDKRFTIMIPKALGKEGNEPVPVGVQGVLYMIPRAVNVDVPASVVEVLKNAVQDIVTQDEDGIIHHDYVPAYPYTVLAEVAAQ